jgi:endonuclease YncB( thermonuclease family)
MRRLACALALAMGSGGAAAQDAAPGEPDRPALTFASQARAFSLARDAAVYVAPSLDAPQMYGLRAGTPLLSTAASNDGAWVVSITEDGQAAFLLAADLGPFDPARKPAPPPPPPVAGVAEVVDTGALLVDGRRVTLAGVTGVGGAYPAQLQALINAQGRAVRCEPQAAQADAQPDTYVCKLPDGLDVARAALFNGAASPSADASADYRQQSEAAKAARRGIWK